MGAAWERHAMCESAFNPSGRTMAVGLTQPLTEMSNRSIFGGRGGKGGWCVGPTILSPSCANFLEILRASTYWRLKDLFLAYCIMKCTLKNELHGCTVHQ